MPEYDAFVSYSSRDEALVKPVVQLIAVGKRKIFWDQQIEPGERWTERIAYALANSATFVVIWCCHSAQSRYVDLEIAAALEQGKPTVPVLICAYPRREPLDEIQGIDLREQAQHDCLDDHPRGDALGRLDARAYIAESFAPNDDPAAATATWVHASFAPIRLRARWGYVAAITGLMLAVFALFNPFHAAVSAITALTGVALTVFGIYRASTAVKPAIKTMILAAVIETAIRQAERGETMRILRRI